MSSKSSNSSIYVGKLSSKVRESDLDDRFSRYGKIKTIDYKKHLGFAFIEFKHSEDSRAAISDMDGRSYFNNRIIVQEKGNF